MSKIRELQECSDPSCFCHDDVIAPPAEPEPEPRRFWVEGQAPKIRPLHSVSVGFIAAALGFADKGPTPPRQSNRQKSQAPFRRGGRG